ncbi:MAG TPA: Gfo/Idh/MocA family oxidoreductase [Verrucomicrobiae bacterium]|nr:Gfo/Idh/MocA family oxidoreductase [Verrucomicrobiae bacterium]
MSDQLRVAVVGAGQMGRLHARVAAESDLTQLSAVVDPDEDRTAVPWLAPELRVDSLDKLLDGEPPDVAIVAVPTHLHADVAVRLLESGIPVLIEKPIAAAVADGKRILTAAEQTGVPVTIGHVERFNPAVRALRKRLDDEQLGRVYQIRTQRLSPFPTRVGDSGVALDMATHDLDVMCMLAGRPVRVSAETDHKSNRAHEDLIAATLRFDSGIIGLLDVNWLTPTKVRHLSVTGERGMFVVDYLNQHLTFYENAQETLAWFTLDVFSGVTEGDVVRYAIERIEPLRAQLDSFVKALRDGREPEVTVEDGLRALSLALAVVESGRSGSSVELQL